MLGIVSSPTDSVTEPDLERLDFGAGILASILVRASWPVMSANVQVPAKTNWSMIQS
jgi:hypothetical protein